MNVPEILDKVLSLSVGTETADNAEKLTFLKYLNIAAADLYREVAAMSPDLIIFHREDDFTELNPIEIFDRKGDPERILKISRLMTKTNEDFRHLPFNEFFVQKNIKEKTLPYPVFSFFGNEIHVYSALNKPYTIFVEYIPEFKPFDYDPETNIGTDESDIPFSISRHSLLIYGTLYYVYQDNDGFKSSVKESLAFNEWKLGIKSYLAELFNKNEYDYAIETRF